MTYITSHPSTFYLDIDTNIFHATVVSKMLDNRTMQVFIKQINNGKCITAVRGSLGYILI